MSHGLVVDLFAGPGGWDFGARSTGLDPLGIERDEAACATRAAAGLRTIRADVAELPLEPFAGRVEGLIASPPCPAFSTAGDGRGVDALDELCDHVRRCEWGWLTWCGDQDPLVWLSLEPLRWLLATWPTWVALEQVPPVLPLWRAYEATLRKLRYRTWAGVLCAADYGVPQTRRRAILLAHRDRQPWPPDPTHAEHPGSLFGLAPWVSMADALGWEGDVSYRRGAGTSGPWVFDRPATTVMGDPRIFRPDGHHGYQDRGSWSGDAIRVELHELGVLQGFPADYPWRGNKSQQATQIGNAVPPPLAAAALRAVAR